MKKLISAILILFLCLGIYSCGKNDAASTASTTTTPAIIIYPFSTATYDGDVADSVVNTCYGTDSSGYTSAPFYSTSIHDLKDRLPSSKWSNPVYSRQGHKISSSWEGLWDGNIDMSLHQAEVIYDNGTLSSNFRGFWTGTKSDGTFSGSNCNDWSYGSNSYYGTRGEFLADNSTWIDNGTKGCDYSSLFLCFKYN